jgi:hypothetical protein
VQKISTRRSTCVAMGGSFSQYSPNPEVDPAGDCYLPLSAPAPAYTPPPQAPPPAPIVTTTVSPTISVSPQISPVFQQQFQPTGSPATAGTTQLAPTLQAPVAPAPSAPAGGAPYLPLAPSPAPTQAPLTYPDISGPIELPGQEFAFSPGGGIAPTELAPTSEQAPQDKTKLWLILGAVGLGVVLLATTMKKKKRA